MTSRVGITGIGLVTPLGIGREAVFRRLLAGESAVAPISSFDTSRFPSHLGAEVTGFSPGDFISPRNARRMDRLSQMAAASARMALDDAGISVEEDNRDRIGIILGTAFGSTEVAAGFAGTLFTEGPRFVSPLQVPNTVMNAPAGHTAIELGIRGVNSTVNHREASAEIAIAYAASEIRKGRADALLTGGVEILSPFFFEILTYFKALSPTDGGVEGPRPFDRHRNGPTAGEGAGVVCLEDLDRAAARGGFPLCEVVGWGMSSAPAPPNDWPSDPKGPVLAMERALRSAGLSPADIDAVSASANGGAKLDRLEAEALTAVFGRERDLPLIFALKGALGESFSSGGIRTGAMALSLSEGMFPPTVGLSDPIASLPFLMKEPTRWPATHGMINGFSSGGTFASVILKRL